MEQSGGTYACERCGSPLEDPQAGRLCTLCAIESADSAVQARQQAAVLSAEKRAAEKPRRRIPTPVLLLGGAICAGLIVWLAPGFIAALQDEPRYREGTYTTAGECDECTENLWTYSQAVGFGAALPTLACPATGEAYVVTGSLADGTLEVHCPNPNEHELQVLWVGSSHLVPEALP